MPLRRLDSICFVVDHRNDIVVVDCRLYFMWLQNKLNVASEEQESLVNAKVSARQQCVYEGS